MAAEARRLGLGDVSGTRRPVLVRERLGDMDRRIFADKANADDTVIERDGAKAVVDEASLPFLAGSEIDFVDEIIGAAFRIHNPNATSGCGCGTSFSL